MKINKFRYRLLRRKIKNIRAGSEDWKMMTMIEIMLDCIILHDMYYIYIIIYFSSII